MDCETFFCEILLPLPLPGTFTYRIPYEWNHKLQFGVRVVVPFGKSKLYSGLVTCVHQIPPRQLVVKYIVDIIDEYPVISEQQFQLWEWMAQYYLCHLGEVMAAALPSALKLAGETKVMLNPAFDGDITHLTEKEVKVAEILSYRTAMLITEVAKASDIQKIIPIIKSLVEKEIVLTDEEIKDPYKPKMESWLTLNRLYANDEQALYALIDQLNNSKRTEKQADTLLQFLMTAKKAHLDNKEAFSYKITKSDLMKAEKMSDSRIKSLVDKQILISEQHIVSRLAAYTSEHDASEITLSSPQQKAINKIEKQLEIQHCVLLHGVTGSGKTEIYIKLINKVLECGKQVLYLLPEIALTTQIVNRLRYYFGDKVGVYHSRFNEYERVEIWSRVLNPDFFDRHDNKYQLILGARSALLLPYHNLGLIIVDEEHDNSYKQTDPAPRYHARDCAVMLAQIHQAKIVMGTATPSLETYYNVERGKYGLTTLTQRYAACQMPEMWVVSIVENLKQKTMDEYLSQFLIDHIAEALARKEQIILFQNRRGYSLRLFCHSCHEMPACIHCDVTLTYHKSSNLLKCHYCGYAIATPRECPVCHSHDIEMKGFGTEKVEQKLAELFPQAVIARMDLDSTRSKTAYQKLIQDFETHKTDILVGTQMVTKGLDFDRVSVVGILNADSLLSYPDFRSFERAYQVMAQVSGRAGRKDVPGKVIIQTYRPEHEAFQYVVAHDFLAMYRHQIREREQLHYPPFRCLIRITLKHKNEATVNAAAEALAPMLKKLFPKQVLGPEFPLVSRIQNNYLKDFWLKLPKNEHLATKKEYLQQLLNHFTGLPAHKSVRIVINVDC
jgi:primosomal protein N' (replication factor Y)